MPINKTTLVSAIRDVSFLSLDFGPHVHPGGRVDDAHRIAPPQRRLAISSETTLKGWKEQP